MTAAPHAAAAAVMSIGASAATPCFGSCDAAHGGAAAQAGGKHPEEGRTSGGRASQPDADCRTLLPTLLPCSPPKGTHDDPRQIVDLRRQLQTELARVQHTVGRLDEVVGRAERRLHEAEDRLGLLVPAGPDAKPGQLAAPRDEEAWCARVAQNVEGRISRALREQVDNVAREVLAFAEESIAASVARAHQTCADVLQVASTLHDQRISHEHLGVDQSLDVIHATKSNATDCRGSGGSALGASAPGSVSYGSCGRRTRQVLDGGCQVLAGLRGEFQEAPVDESDVCGSKPIGSSHECGRRSVARGMSAEPRATVPEKVASDVCSDVVSTSAGSGSAGNSANISDRASSSDVGLEVACIPRKADGAATEESRQASPWPPMELYDDGPSDTSTAEPHGRGSPGPGSFATSDHTAIADQGEHHCGASTSSGEDARVSTPVDGHVAGIFACLSAVGGGRMCAVAEKDLLRFCKSCGFSGPDSEWEQDYRDLRGLVGQRNDRGLSAQQLARYIDFTKVLADKTPAHLLAAAAVTACS